MQGIDQKVVFKCESAKKQSAEHAFAADETEFNGFPDVADLNFAGNDQPFRGLPITGADADAIHDGLLDCVCSLAVLPRQGDVEANLLVR